MQEHAPLLADPMARRVWQALWPRVQPGFVAALLIAHSAWAFRFSAELPRYSDEMFHVPQIRNFCAGRYALDAAITMLPGYHLLSAGFARLLGECSPRVMRGFNVLCGLLVTWAAYQIVRALRSKYPLRRASAFYFLPLFYPYQFVAFTDVSALLFALLAVLSMVKQRWALAGLTASLGVLLRQTNVVLLAFLLLSAALRYERTQPLSVLLRRTWSSLLGCVGFGVFMLLNEGVAIGDRSSHRAGLHVGNVYLCLFLLAFTALPVGLSTLWHRRTALRSKGFIAMLLTAAVVYANCFEVSHHYNLLLNFLRNVLLHWATLSASHRALFFIPVALGLGIATVTRFAQPAFWVWLPIALITLLPEGLIEQRYALLPIALFTLLRKDGAPLAEALSVLGNAAISGSLLWVMADGKFGL